MNIKVKVTGCVIEAGDHILCEAKDLGEALQKAGGLNNEGPALPSGIITIRSKRNSNGLYYRRKIINLNKRPYKLNFRLQDGDLVIAQYKV